MGGMFMMCNREVKRVPLDFDWPLDKVWEGYIQTGIRDCPDCDCGFTAARLRLQDLVRLIMLSGSDSIRGENHPYFSECGGLYHNVIPGPDMAELTDGLAGRPADRPFGHDSMDNWKAEGKIIAAAGLDPDTWGICTTCKGHAIHPDDIEKCENWEPTQPPTGEGWQAWETTSEGSPISPVFPTLDKLCAWMAENADMIGHKKTAEQWRAILTGEAISEPMC